MPWYYFIVSWTARADNSRLSYYLNRRNSIQNKLSKTFIKSCWVQILYKFLRFSYELVYTWRTTNQNTTPRGSSHTFEFCLKLLNWEDSHYCMVKYIKASHTSSTNPRTLCTRTTTTTTTTTWGHPLTVLTIFLSFCFVFYMFYESKCHSKPLISITIN